MWFNCTGCEHCTFVHDYTECHMCAQMIIKFTEPWRSRLAQEVLYHSGYRHVYYTKVKCISGIRYTSSAVNVEPSPLPLQCASDGNSVKLLVHNSIIDQNNVVHT